MDKKEIMKKLIDLYDQREFVEYECSKMIIDEYINKLEKELKGML